MMKDFNKFVQRKIQEGQLVDHKDVGLPEEITGEDVVNIPSVWTEEALQESMNQQMEITTYNDTILEEGQVDSSK